MSSYFLTSGRLGFRIWANEDLPLAMQLWGDERVTRWIDARGQLTSVQVAERLSKEIETERRFGLQYWPVFLLADAQFIGCCGVRPYKPEEGILELGVHLCASQWGHGYAAEAALTVMKYAFTRLDAKALFAGHNPKNDASRKLLLKIGFHYTHDEYYAPTGLQHPSYLLTAAEYAE